ncbi:hypothetical protein GCM10020001_021730 [Nonomuraea salmonea]
MEAQGRRAPGEPDGGRAEHPAIEDGGAYPHLEQDLQHDGGAKSAYTGGRSSATGSHHADSRSRDTPAGMPSRLVASMQTAPHAMRAANVSASRHWKTVNAESMTIATRSRATIAHK